MPKEKRDSEQAVSFVRLHLRGRYNSAKWSLLDLALLSAVATPESVLESFEERKSGALMR
jgi:hypothetical protein